MKLAIIGWYGTETIGDRAILAGLIKLLLEVDDSIELYLGSIYPFFSERTIHEDIDFYKKITGKNNIKINLFDSRNHKTLTQTIKMVDCIAVGGGPLLDVSWMYMIEYAFMKAKKHNKKTILLGCGLGPLNKRTYLKAACNIIKYSDFCIFRDEASLNWANELVENKQNMFALIDPAAFAAAEYIKRDTNEVENDNYIVVNLREFPMEYAINDTKDRIEEINQSFIQMLKNLAVQGMPVRLIPMHYFSIGGDDRKYLNQLAMRVNLPNVHVQNDPLTLEETMHVFKHAKIAIGMRFHSVVLQTICNGNNYVLDYTNPINGKIGGFLNQVNGMEFYKNRYMNIQKEKTIQLSFADNSFDSYGDELKKYEKQYKCIFQDFFN